jgi:ATP-dependent DNA ligase
VIRPLQFPAPHSIPLENALSWGQSTDWLYEEKKDGARALLSGGKLFGRSRDFDLPGSAGLITSTLDGELVGGVFFVFDILSDQTGNCLVAAMPLWKRKQLLVDLEPLFPSWMKLLPWTRGNGGEFLEAVLANGGEGVVAKCINSPYGFDWIKAKRIETHDCIVTAVHDAIGASVSLGQYLGSQLIDCGRCQLPQSKIGQIKVGSIIEIACHSRTKAGKFREPRLIRVRQDKPAEACSV